MNRSILLSASLAAVIAAGVTTEPAAAALVNRASTARRPASSMDCARGSLDRLRNDVARTKRPPPIGRHGPMTVAASMLGFAVA